MASHITQQYLYQPTITPYFSPDAAQKSNFSDFSHNGEKVIWFPMRTGLQCSRSLLQRRQARISLGIPSVESLRN